MTSITRASAKAYFETGDFPSESNFADTLDSTIFQIGTSAQVITSNVSALGNWDFKKDITVSGGITTNALNITGTFSANGNIFVNGNVNASAANITARIMAGPVLASQAGESLTVNNLAAFTDGTTTVIAGITGTTGIVGTFTNHDLILRTNNAERARIDKLGNVVVNTAALAVGATDGFLYIPSMPGNPTGTPTAFTGRVPIVYNASANRIYVYNGSWRSVAVT